MDPHPVTNSWVCQIIMGPFFYNPHLDGFILFLCVAHQTTYAQCYPSPLTTVSQSILHYLYPEMCNIQSAELHNNDQSIMTLNQIILQTCLYVTHSRTSLWMLKLQILQISLRCYFIWVKIKFVPERFSSAPYKMIALVMIIIQINSSQVKLHNYLTHYHATTIVLHCSSFFS